MSSKILFAVGIFAVALAHFITSFFVAFAAGISAPDESRVLRVLAAILTFPLSFVPDDFPEALGLTPWILLSLCWGLAICFGIRALLATIGR
ncbi:MAG: hypothetical protein H7Z42_07305 [Roseiflexaceae bacterium]|nr:hypothetical protein [Roseiflexaceae bacterium]